MRISFYLNGIGESVSPRSISFEIIMSFENALLTAWSRKLRLGSCFSEIKTVVLWRRQKSLTC
jgi:hypothetical protein